MFREESISCSACHLYARLEYLVGSEESRSVEIKTKCPYCRAEIRHEVHVAVAVFAVRPLHEPPALAPVADRLTRASSRLIDRA